MKTKMLMAVILAVTVVGMNVNAGFVVYKTKNIVMEYQKPLIGGTDWLPTAGKKLQVETYTVFQTAGNLLTDATAPQRVVFTKPAKGQTATVAGKKVTKLIINPNATGANGYESSAIAAPYLAYSGAWAVKVLNSSANPAKNSMGFIYDYSVEAAGQDIERVGENYGGKVSTDKTTGLIAPKSFTGSYSYVAGSPLLADMVGQDTKGNLKLDKKLSETVANAANMTAAVDAVVAYLETKKYVSTWDE